MKNQLPFSDLGTAFGIQRCFPVLLAILICSFWIPTTALAFPENSSDMNSSATGTSEYSHLIELSFEDDNYIVAGEAIVYSTGVNDSQELILWIPDNADIMEFQATDMMASVASTPVNYSRDGNLLYFTPPLSINSSDMPLLYGIKYAIQSSGQVREFNKKLSEEGLFSNQVSKLILVVNHEENELPSVTSADGTQIKADQVSSESNQTSYIWSSPQFTEFNVVLEESNYSTASEKSSDSLIIPAILIGILIIGIIAAALFYTRKENSGKTEELEDIYDAEMTVIAKIKEDYKKNRLSKDEFENILKKHSDNASRIKNKMEKLKKT